MIYNFKTKKALKFLVWLGTGLNALVFCVFSAMQSGDVKMAVFGAAAMLLQVVHGVRVAFFNKTLVNMSLGFCKFQLVLLLIFSLVAAFALGGTYGIVFFALAEAEYIASMIIVRRKKIVEAVKELLII
ncbi:MAG: hypothetical protein IJW21_06720 [Clostridia bacterium]|nr:hypothetical protein [Clostridia bacterium]